VCLILLYRIYRISAPRGSLCAETYAEHPTRMCYDYLGNPDCNVRKYPLFLATLITTTPRLCCAKDWQTIAGIRVCIGAAEAFLQAAPLYLTFWYKRNELATRIAIFFSMMAIAGSMNGIIAYGIERNMDGLNGWRPWRWIFLVEGKPSSSFWTVPR
jgi:hypothetical protein